MKKQEGPQELVPETQQGPKILCPKMQEGRKQLSPNTQQGLKQLSPKTPQAPRRLRPQVQQGVKRQPSPKLPNPLTQPNPAPPQQQHSTAIRGIMSGSRVIRCGCLAISDALVRTTGGTGRMVNFDRKTGSGGPGASRRGDASIPGPWRRKCPKSYPVRAGCPNTPEETRGSPPKSALGASDAWQLHRRARMTKIPEVSTSLIWFIPFLAGSVAGRGADERRCRHWHSRIPCDTLVCKEIWAGTPTSAGLAFFVLAHLGDAFQCRLVRVDDELRRPKISSKAFGGSHHAPSF